MRHAVIMAGGAGTRLWPLSRQNRPKQTLKLFSGRSLIRESYERLASWMPPSSIYVITNDAHLPMIAEDLPEIPRENLFGEPVGRDTANAVGLSAAIIAERDPQGTIGIFTADHIIKPLDNFRNAVEAAMQAAEDEEGALVTMGITPSRPDVNYGYVRRGQQASKGVFEVKNFEEKPDAETAKNYLASGDYYWNSGMFAWRADSILAELHRNLPDSYPLLRELGDAWDDSTRDKKLREIYPNLPKISIDYAVMEKADRVLVVEMNCDWIDVGSWPAIQDVIEADSAGNVSAALKSLHLDSKDNIVVSEEDHLITTLGVKGLVIINSPDATLVCTKEDASRIKELLDLVKEEHGERYS